MRARRLVAGLGALGLVIGVAGACGSGGSATAAAENLVPNAEELVPAFGVDQSPRDEVRGEIAEISGIAPQTSRLLGEANDVRFWAVATPDGDICLIAQLPNGEHALPGDDPVTGTTCTPSFAFAARGTEISVNGHTAAHGIVAHLLPANATDSSVQEAAAQLGDDADALVSREGTHIFALTPDAADRARGVTISTIDGGSFNLASLATCGAGCG